MTESITNAKWLMTRIVESVTMDELEEVLVDIKCDQFEQEPWTKDEITSKRMQNLYVRQKQRITKLDEVNEYE